MALTDIAIRNAKPRAKPYKMGDERGLFLLVQPSGGKLWKVKYRIDGREKKLSLGTYPDVSLRELREGETWGPSEGRKLFTRFHATRFPNKIREEYKLNRADAGWYQVRRALEAYGDIELTDFDPFKAAYTVLSNKLRPKVFELGFLPE